MKRVLRESTMWSVAQACRCAPLALRTAPNRLLVTTKSGLTNTVVRQLVTPSRNYNKYGLNSFKGLRLQDVLKSNGIVMRLCSNTPKTKAQTPKAVGYWLLGCSGMVFTAVVLGMVAGYLVLLYSIYYIVRIVINTTNGSK